MLQTLLLDYCFAVEKNQPNIQLTVLRRLQQEAHRHAPTQIDAAMATIACLLPASAYDALQRALFPTILLDREELHQAEWDQAGSDQKK
tara:strand:+ start:94 stop:360 length:267 start_codon:yes stop_codon:yes gene_type:complete